ncbi:MAG: hypothetical protein QOG31_1296 [Thermoplasmata archaeon]|jgi:hypothetical protein|nr:hypothetical protein [Thermoplasmata archaeon]
MRSLATVAAAVLLAALLSGCAQGPKTPTTATTAPGAATPMTFFVHDVGAKGPEPSIGVTSDGAIFFQALEKTMKSSDGGTTWRNVNAPYSLPTTLDPFLWVDPVTDRVFANQLYVACSYLTFSDDGGATWLANPAACGTPANDHQKVTTGPYVEGSPLALAATGHRNVYPNVVYYAVNGLADSRVAMSIDGGATFPFVAETNPVDLPNQEKPDCAAGLHGSITAAPDGTVYVPLRSACAGPKAKTSGGPVVARSLDNGLTWATTVVGGSVGTSDHDKNPELGIDRNNTLYLVWPGGDNRLYLSHSADHGAGWSPPVLVTPELGTVTMPVVQAGSPGRIAIAYYGIDNRTELAVPDKVNETARWSLFVTYSLDALAETPTFHTTKVTGDDPIQVGAISTNTGDAPAGSRNLLDFIDMVIDRDGRAFVAFADGCTSAACHAAGAKPTDSRDALGTVAIAEGAPSLYAEKGWLAPR